MRAHTAHGLIIHADRQIPGLALAADPDATADVQVHLEAMSSHAGVYPRALWYQTPTVNGQGRPNLVIWRTAPGGFHFQYDNGAEFFIEPDARHIWCTWPASLTVAESSVYLRGPILGLVLRLRGIVSLHASSLAVGSVAFALLGNVGAGKSTTAAALVEHGCSLLADDVSAMQMNREGIRVLPGIPRISLWSDAAAAVYGRAHVLPRLTPAGGALDWWDKRYVDVSTDQFCRRAMPLAALYVLRRRMPDATTPRIEEIAPKDAFIALTDETYVNYALDRDMRAREFHLLGQLIRQVRIRQIVPPDDPGRLRDLCRAILDDVSASAASASTGPVRDR